MGSQERVRELIYEQMLKSKKQNANFSMRALAKKMGLSPSTVSEILQGKRNASKKLAARIAEKLMLSPREMNDLLASFDANKKEVKAKFLPKKYLELQADEFSVVSAWEHFAILALMGTKKFQHSSDYIANRLGLTKRQVHQALSRLERVKLVKKTNTGKLVRVKAGSLSSTDGISNSCIRKSHHESLSLARDSIDQLEVDARDLTSVTIAVNSKKFKEAQKRIREFRTELCQLLQTGEKDEVFKLNIQLFPISKLTNTRRKK